MKARTDRPLVMPAFGVIRGGRLDGWRYHFIEFQVMPAGQDIRILARCTPPNWPFPCDIPMTPEHFRQLRAVVGERAKRLPAEPLIAVAFKRAGVPAPKWLEDRARLRTVRAVAKRSMKGRAS